MNYNKADLDDMAKKLHVVRDTLEKVVRLADILRLFEKDKVLSGSFALKGGTAINLMVFNLPRLSTDIDLDLSENIPKDELSERRKLLRNRIDVLMGTEGYSLGIKSRSSFALDSLLFEYTNAGGNRDRLKMDLNYSMRAHVLPLCTETSKPGFVESFSTTMVNPIEVYASKTVALMTRAAARDLYDMNYFVRNVRMNMEDSELYRKSVVFYLALSENPLNLSFDAMDNITPNVVFRDLVQVMRDKESFELKKAKKDVRAFLEENIRPTEEEMLFLQNFVRGEYHPELVFDSPEIFSRLENHPMALWKAHTYRKV